MCAIFNFNSELLENTKRHEEEITLRLQFEEKLNTLHSLQRFTEERYQRALNEIDEFSLNVKEQAKIIKSFKNELGKYLRRFIENLGWTLLMLTQNQV